MCMCISYKLYITILYVHVLCSIVFNLNDSLVNINNEAKIVVRFCECLLRQLKATEFIIYCFFWRAICVLFVYIAKYFS